MTTFSTSTLQPVGRPRSVFRDPRLGCTPIGLATAGGSTPAMLVTWAGDLVAILSEADMESGPDATWFVEFGLGPCESPPAGLFFDTLDEAVHWAERRCRELGGIGLA